MYIGSGIPDDVSDDHLPLKYGGQKSLAWLMLVSMSTYYGFTGAYFYLGWLALGLLLSGGRHWIPQYIRRNVIGYAMFLPSGEVHGIVPDTTANVLGFPIYFRNRSRRAQTYLPANDAEGKSIPRACGALVPCGGWRTQGALYYNGVNCRGWKVRDAEWIKRSFGDVTLEQYTTELAKEPSTRISQVPITMAALFARHTLGHSTTGAEMLREWVVGRNAFWECKVPTEKKAA